MNETILKKDSVKKKSLLLTCFVLISLFPLEIVFAHNYWKKELVEVHRDKKNGFNQIKTEVYNLKCDGIVNKYAYPSFCVFQYSADGDRYYNLMEIQPQNPKSLLTTTVYLKNKLEGAKIEFQDNATSPRVGSTWPENLSSSINVTVRNIDSKAHLVVGWHTEEAVRFIRVSGIWCVDQIDRDKVFDKFKKIKYEVKSSAQLQSNTPGIKTKVSKSDIARVFKESEAIVIKGAETGANIKVYTTSGVEIKSVVSNNDVVKIELPEKQFYIVHIGKSRYKVAL